MKLQKTSKNRYKIWFKQGEYDYEAGIISFNQGYYEWATYQAEQAVEKTLKSVIAKAGWHPPRVHKIAILLGICNHVNLKFKQTKFDFKHLESFTFISRYPFLIPGKNETPHDLISKHDAKRALKQAKDIIDKIRNLLHEHGDDNFISDAKIMAYDQAQINRRLDEINTALIKEFNPEKIILFGSYAREIPVKKTGTMDILIIAYSNDRFIDRIKLARAVTRGGDPIIEPLVYTPSEFEYMLNEEGEGFVEAALREGKVIYQKE